MYIQVSILCIIILDILVILHPCSSMLSRWQLAFYSQNIWSQLMHTQNLLDQRLFGHESCYESITPSRHTSWSSITSQKLAGVELSILGFTVLSRGQRFRSTDHRHPSKLEAARAADGGMLTSEQLLKLCCHEKWNPVAWAMCFFICLNRKMLNSQEVDVAGRISVGGFFPKPYVHTEGFLR